MQALKVTHLLESSLIYPRERQRRRDAGTAGTWCTPLLKKLLALQPNNFHALLGKQLRVVGRNAIISLTPLRDTTRDSEKLGSLKSQLSRRRRGGMRASTCKTSWPQNKRERTVDSNSFVRTLQNSHRKIKTQILEQPNPETKGNKNMFRAHFETYSKTHFVAS